MFKTALVCAACTIFTLCPNLNLSGTINDTLCFNKTEYICDINKSCNSLNSNVCSKNLNFDCLRDNCNKSIFSKCKTSNPSVKVIAVNNTFKNIDIKDTFEEVQFEDIPEVILPDVDEIVEDISDIKEENDTLDEESPILPNSTETIQNTSKEEEITSLLYGYINDLRTSVGVGTLSKDDSLVNIASIRANEASSYWSHTRPNGENSLDMLPRDKWAGENLSYLSVYKDMTDAEGIAKQMFNSLVNSPSHYENMVFGTFTKIGISTYKTEEGSQTKYTSAYIFSN